MAALGLQPKEASGIYFSTEFAEVRLGWYMLPIHQCSRNKNSWFEKDFLISDICAR